MYVFSQNTSIQNFIQEISDSMTDFHWFRNEIQTQSVSQRMQLKLNLQNFSVTLDSHGPVSDCLNEVAHFYQLGVINFDDEPDLKHI